MRRCHRCDRHVFETSTRCPFCGAPHRVVAAPVFGVLLGLAGASCSDRPADDQGSGAGTTTSASSTTSDSANTTSDGASGPLSATADGTSTTLGPATTAMTTAATDDGTTSGSTTGESTSGGTTLGTTDTTIASEDTFPLPPYAGAFPDEDESTSTTG
jgi:hypothetical protein